MITRQELKFLIHHFDYVTLTHKLKYLLAIDVHSAHEDYSVKSLYFDDIYNSAYHDKVDGVRDRIKYRIRYYGHDNSFKLEKKIKRNNQVKKESSVLNVDEYRALLAGQYQIFESDSLLLKEFKAVARRGHSTPKVIVDYQREAYTFPINKIRITFDKHLKTHLNNVDLLNASTGFHVLPPNMLILEIKFDGFLPGFIRQQLGLDSRPQLALSKYVICRDRMYG